MKEKKGNLHLEKVISKRCIGEINTYDFTIPKTHCFFANNILVHNTGMLEQLSHVVLIIYAYIEMGIEHYRIKIAKNRSGERGSQEVRFIGCEYRFEEII